MKGDTGNVESMHYDPLFEKKREMLPVIIRNELTGRQQLVIELYYQKELGEDEIAGRLGITRTSVQRLRHRAEERIAHYLQYCT